MRHAANEMDRSRAMGEAGDEDGPQEEAPLPPFDEERAKDVVAAHPVFKERKEVARLAFDIGEGVQLLLLAQRSKRAGGEGPGCGREGGDAPCLQHQ